MIELSNLSIGYSRDKPLLSDFNLCLENNKIYGILGESGRGKTTLLRTIAGLLKPLAGNIRNDDPSQKIFMMHQSYTSFDWLNCRDNVTIAAKVNGERETSGRAEEMLTAVGLAGYEKKYPKQLSGGQRQRLALARTLFINPATILMDEPLSALDDVTRRQMQNLILSRHQKEKNIIVLVTHSPEEAKRMCDEIITL